MDNAMQNLLIDQAGYALFFSFLIQWMKNSKWFPFIKADTVALNRFLALVASGATALGIHHTFNAAAGTLTITGLTLPGVYHGAWEWVRSLMIQEITYQKFVRKDAPPATPPAVQTAPGVTLKTA